MNPSSSTFFCRFNAASVWALVLRLIPFPDPDPDPDPDPEAIGEAEVDAIAEAELVEAIGEIVCSSSFVVVVEFGLETSVKVTGVVVLVESEAGGRGGVAVEFSGRVILPLKPAPGPVIPCS